MFTVVMPVFNQEKYINQAIQSVIEQTFLNWEMVIVDNFSTDKTFEIIQSFSDTRIRIHQIQNNDVIARSRNFAIQSSRAKYIAFLDSDDLWSPNKLDHVMRQFNLGADIVYHDVEIISSENVSMGTIKSRQIKTPQFEDLLMNGNPIVNSSAVIKSSLLYEIGLLSDASDLAGVEDYNAWLKSAHRGASFHHIPEMLGVFRIHTESFSALNPNIGVPRRAFRGLEEHISEELGRRIESRYWEIRAKTLFREKSFKHSKESFKLAAENALGLKRHVLLFYKKLAALSQLFDSSD
jgi:glycosyltransferase involved in cell wall biosynthesis